MRRFTLSAFLLLALLLTSAFPAVATAAEASPLGKQIDNFSLDDFRGKTWSLDDFSDKKIVVVAFLGVECPLVKQYASRLEAIGQKYAEQGVAVVGINSNQQDSLTEIGHFARVHKITFPLLKDPGNAIADRFAAQRTPEIFVLDDERNVRYHGRIDDQFTYGIQRPEVKREYLTSALDDLLAGREVAAPESQTVGCHIGRVLRPEADSDVTYSNQISRILQKRCVECHRSGEIAPFALTDYDEVAGWAEMIAEVVNEQRMPPWHASPEHGKFVNDARLTDDEKNLINRWVDAGAPQGDPSKLPPPREFTEGWRISQPDLIVEMPKTFDVPAAGEVAYQYFVVDPGFTEDKWVVEAECRPGNRAVVHHIIVFVKPPGAQGRGAHGLHSTWLAATAPGARPLLLGDGRAKFIPKGSTLVFQMHYTPIGEAQQDRSSVGLVFADPAEVKQEVVTRQAATQSFRIPPGAENHKVEATHTLRQDTLLLAMFPHMHLRGKAFRYTAIYPEELNRPDEILLDIPSYDFNWQNSYEFAEPKKLPAGTKLFCEARFDNSEYNLANPDPTATVKWGDQTWEEMMIGYFDMALAGQDLTTGAKQATRTDAFLARIDAGDLTFNGEVKLTGELRAGAAAALASNEKLQQFALALQKIVPQLDRVCWITIDDDKLAVQLAAQDSDLQRTIGGAGVKVPAAGMALAGYIAGKETVVHNDLALAESRDLQFLARGVSSSMHLPRKLGETAGVLSFWSTEKNAFPKEAVRLLEQVADAMASQASGE